MKPKWKGVAERAYNRTFGIEEISTAMMPALARDCRDELTTGFIDRIRGLCEEQETLLIKDDIKSRLEALRPDAGNGIGRRILENVHRISREEEVTVKTAVQAVERALVERAAKSNRQMEEHTARLSTAARANDFRNRLEQATAKAPINGLARQLLKLDNTRSPRTSVKRDGLEEGPKIK
jgi:hypothetical protein